MLLTAKETYILLHFVRCHGLDILGVTMVGGGGKPKRANNLINQLHVELETNTFKVIPSK